MTQAEMILKIIGLLQDLTPEAVALIHNLLADLSGVPADQVLDQALTKFQAIHAKAIAAQGGAAPAANPA